MGIDRFVFAVEHREQLASLSARSDRLAALASSFPLLFFALATGYGNDGETAQAIRMVEEGHDLKDVAAVLQLPMALKRVKPEMLTEALVRAQFTQEGAARLTRFAGRAGPTQSNGVAVAFYGSRLADDAFGVWLAQQCVCDRAHQLEAVRWIALYAWASNQVDDPGLNLAAQPWCPGFSFRMTFIEMQNWVHRLRWRPYFQGVALPDRWMHAGSHGGYDFVPLRTFADMQENVATLPNGLGWCADRLMHGTTRYYGVRRSGDVIATIEVVWNGMDGYCITGISGHPGQTLSPDANAAIDAWWSDHAPWRGARQELPLESPGPEQVFLDIERRYARARHIGGGFWRTPFTWSSYLPDLHALARGREIGHPFERARTFERFPQLRQQRLLATERGRRWRQYVERLADNVRGRDQ